MELVEYLVSSLDTSKALHEASSGCVITPHRGSHFQISCNVSSRPASSTYALFVLPPSLFVDKYELEQRCIDNDGPCAQVWGETNLELPLASDRLDMRGSAVLLALGGDYLSKFDMPLHARYALPSGGETSPRTHVTIDISEPRFFVSKMPLNSSNDWSGLAVSTIPYSNAAPLRIEVPTGHSPDLAFVEPLTVIAIIASFFYVSSAIWKWSTSRQSANLAKKSS